MADPDPIPTGSYYDLDEEVLILPDGERVPFFEVGWDPESDGKRATIMAGPTLAGTWVVFEIDERGVS